MLSKKYKMTYQRMFNELLGEVPSGFFDEAALPSYTHHNTLMSWLFWKRIDTALTMAGDIREKSVLDFGCGGGVLFQFLQENKCMITGCDSDACELAQNVTKKLNIEADLRNNLLKISDRTFDFIFALDVLEHIENLDRYLDKLSELSHDKTVLVISGPTEGLAYRTGRWLAGFSGHYHLRNIYEIENLMRRKRFNNISVKNLYYPFPLFRISSWHT